MKVAMEIQVEERRGVYIATWPVAPGPEEVRTFFSYMEKELTRRRPMVLILDATSVRTAPSEIRQIVGEWLRKHRSELSLYLRAEATVIANPLVRGALAAVHFFAPPGYPARTFGSLAPAVAWAEAQLPQPSSRR